MFRIQSHIIFAASLARLISIYCPPLYLTQHLCKQQVNPFSCTHGPHVSNQPKGKESPQIAPETNNSFSSPSLSAYLLNVPTTVFEKCLNFLCSVTTKISSKLLLHFEHDFWGESPDSKLLDKLLSSFR